MTDELTGAVQAGGPDDADVEYEYVYEDENGNPIDPPPEGAGAEAYEEEVIRFEDEGPEPEAPPVPASAETVTLAPGPRGGRTGSTKTTATRPSRRRPGSSTGRISSRQTDPVAEMKYARLKTVLMIGSLALIPVLIVAIVLTHCYKKGYWPFRRAPKTVMVQSEVDQALDIRTRALRAHTQARQLMQDGKDKQAYDLYSVAEGEFLKARDLLQGWREKNPDAGYSRFDDQIADINIKLREARECKFRIEMRPK